ncbi:phage tail tube protein [Ancylobacter pratisalsi]|uniref:Phage tail protein n=1 Tax=Ancylobacter pratisalsi TaxID=1745854 RepID=A0A6P1YIW3_9HYPH|nr:phage tail tube protein [Ancylobacter pratisalsi]QIB32636.1 phage tail protein [Ancylobacter pratisalsi]
MSLENARELYIKRSNGDSPETFSTVCGVRTRSLQMSNAQIDTTIPDCDDPSAPIVATAAPGRQTLTFSGDGLFVSSDSGVAVADDARLQRVTNYQIRVVGYGVFEGPFMVADFELSGDMEEKMAFSATWVPTDAGTLTFTAEA